MVEVSKRQRCAMCERYRLPGKTGWLTMDEFSADHGDALLDLEEDLIRCDDCKREHGEEDGSGLKKRKRRKTDDDEDDDHDGFDPRPGQYRKR